MEEDSESSQQQREFEEIQQQSQQQNEGKNKQGGSQVNLSKKQRKKLIKKQKWQKEKLQRRKQQRGRQRQKKKLKKMQLKQENQQDPTQKAEKQELNLLMRKRKEDYHDKMAQGLKVIIDLQFYDLMTEKEQNSLIKQLSHCHSINRKSHKCFNYILTSATKGRQETFAKRYNADKWGIQAHEQNLTQVFPRQKLVYLTGDAQQEIQHFDPELIYIIGGIVDHNRLKKITYNYAVQNKIVAKRLPMNSVKLKASVHLAVNHVWQWMLRSYNGASWDDALKAVLPLRKLEFYNEV